MKHILSNECKTAIVCEGTSFWTSFSLFICKQEEQPLPATGGRRLSVRSAAGLLTVELLGDRDTGIVRDGFGRNVGRCSSIKPETISMTTA
jgi:hypothetical protein